MRKSKWVKIFGALSIVYGLTIMIALGHAGLGLGFLNVISGIWLTGFGAECAHRVEKRRRRA